MDVVKEIEVLIRAKYPIVWVVTWEERRVERAMQEVADRLNRTFHGWSVTQGMRPAVQRSAPAKPTTLPGELEVLAQIHEAPEFTVFLLKDFHPYMRDNRVVRLLRDLAGRLRGRSQTVFLVSPNLSLPPELEKEVTVIEWPLPGVEEINQQLDEIVKSVGANDKLDLTLTPENRELIVHSAQGLTADEIESAMARSLVEAKKFDVATIIEEKKQIVRKTGTLEFYPTDQGMSDVGGHDLLK
jgi:hypothetical protein